MEKSIPNYCITLYCDVLEMNNNDKSASNKSPPSESISVSDVLYQLSSLRKVSAYLSVFDIIIKQLF